MRKLAVVLLLVTALGMGAACTTSPSGEVSIDPAAVTAGITGAVTLIIMALLFPDGIDLPELPPLRRRNLLTDPTGAA